MEQWFKKGKLTDFYKMGAMALKIKILKSIKGYFLLNLCIFAYHPINPFLANVTIKYPLKT